MPPSSLISTDVSPTSALISWLPPEGGDHPCLRGFQMNVVSAADGKTFRSMAISKVTPRFALTSLSPASEYEVTVLSVASSSSAAVVGIAGVIGPAATKKYESEAAKIELLTPPEVVRNLRLDYATPNSVVVKWDAPAQGPPPAGVKYLLSIEMLPLATTTTTDTEDTNEEEKAFSNAVSVSGEKLAYNFSKLPDPDGTGRQYKVSIVVAATLGKEGRYKEAKSAAVSATFSTLPLKPSNLKPSKSPNGITWTRSQTPTVKKYRVTWKRSEEGAKLNEKFVAHQDQEEQEAELDELEPSSDGVYYKVNVYAVAEGDNVIESRELHEKFAFKKEDDEECRLFIYEEAV